MSLNIIILAAGQGTRMRSGLPKVLHKLAGRSLLEHVCRATLPLEAAATYVVYGHGGEQVLQDLSHLEVNWVLQDRQLGTGHAVRQAIPDIPDDADVLVLYGDIPLITTATLSRLVDGIGATGFSLLTSHMENPYGYGRIIRDDQGNICRIVEEKDASDEERSVNEINTGMMAVRAGPLKRWLGRLDQDNAQGEFYLTDIIQMAVEDDILIQSVLPVTPEEINGINTRGQLAAMERSYQLQQARSLMEQGVSFYDPARFDLRGELTTGIDVIIDINVVMEGSVIIGDRVSIGPNCVIRNCKIDDDVQILPNCVIENAVIGRHCRIGPFSRIRPQTRLAEDVHVGNFVEVKNSEIGRASKVNHLSYVGDSELGRDVNVGAGTITCNYDGAYKHRTIIEDDVHIGSDTQLVAPVRVGRGVTIGAGTTITRDVDSGLLIHNRFETRTVKGWKRPTKEGK